MERLKLCLHCVVLALLCAILGTAAYLTLTHGPAVAQNVRTASLNTAQATGDLKDAATALKAAADDLKIKAATIDVRPVNDALRNVQRVTGDAAFVTAQLRERYPIIEVATSLLWQHADATVGHLDVATLDEQKQQKQIAEKTITALDSLNTVVSDPNIPLAVSHVSGAAAAVEGIAEDVHEITSTSKHIFTWPKDLWHKLRPRK